jgi:hypothetical protein
VGTLARAGLKHAILLSLAEPLVGARFGAIGERFVDWSRKLDSTAASRGDAKHR